MSFAQSTAWLVLCAVLATAAAKEWHEGVVFSNTAKAATASTNTKTKVSGDYQAPELRQVCLREAKDTFGCPSALQCGTEPDCPGCETEQSYQTELTCCKDKDDEGYGAAGDMNLLAPALKVGTCDWTFSEYQCDSSVYGAECPLSGGFYLENNAEKISTVWGTCYFNSESESCGHPFCDKMVMSFQGGEYLMAAYAVGDPADQLPELDDSCRGVVRQERLKRVAKRSKVAQKFLKKDPTAFDRLSSRRGSSSTGTDKQYYSGMATVVSGPVTVTSLSHNVEYTRGMLEWISYFKQMVDPTSTPPASTMPVVPYTMTITLASTKGSYDSYQPRVDESSYGNEGYHN